MTSTNRRHVLHLLAAAAGMAALPAMTAAPAQIAMEVWKDPNCGCCKDWIALMEQAGFAVKVHDVGNSAVAKGCGILGEVKNSVLSYNTQVGQGASVCYSVVMPGAVIEEGAVVQYAIIG